MRISARARAFALTFAVSLAACGGGDTPPPGVDAGSADLGVPVTDLGERDAQLICTSDIACNDGLYCNGREMCAPASAMADARGCIADTPPCAPGAMCAEDTDSCGTCSTDDADADGVSECDGDCDDSDAARYPGNAELCDSDDEDCDDATYGARDDDGDTFTSVSCCNGGTCGTDCDDARGGVHPTATEACNGIDDNCDGATDEGVSQTVYRDADMDLHGDPAVVLTAGCLIPAGYVLAPSDCDDSRVDVHPGATEVCDGVDQDCSTTDGLEPGEDADGDAHAPVGATCAGGPFPADDCDDTNRDRHPGQDFLDRATCESDEEICLGADGFSYCRPFVIPPLPCRPPLPRLNWDWDCDGVVERAPGTGACLPGGLGCDDGCGSPGWQYVDRTTPYACGDTVEYLECSCVSRTCRSTVSTRPLGCR